MLRWFQFVSAERRRACELRRSTHEDVALPPPGLPVVVTRSCVCHAAVGLPRQLRVLADLGDSTSPACSRSAGLGVELRPLGVRAGGEHALEDAAGVRRRAGLDCATTSSGVPAATTRPPPMPASGPRSMTQSAVLMTSRLCSTTTTVLPRSTSRLEHVEQLADVVEVQAGRRLVEEVERPAGVGPGQLGGQLDALGLAAGERRRRLAEREVAEADVGQRLQDAADLRDVGEQLQRLADAHVQHVGDRSCPCSLTASVSGL